MRFRDFTLFGKTFVVIPSNVDFNVVVGNGDEVHQYTNLDDIASDQLLWDALYAEEAPDGE